MNLIQELNRMLQLYEELSSKTELGIKWFIREILYYLIPDWKDSNPEEAIFPKSDGNYEVKVAVRFTKKKGIWFDFSKRTLAQYTVAVINILTTKSGNNVTFYITVNFFNSYINKFTNLNLNNVSTRISIPISELEKGFSSLRYLEPVLHSVKQDFETLFRELEKVKGK